MARYAPIILFAALAACGNLPAPGVPLTGERPDRAEVPPAAGLAFGEIARTCGMATGTMGQAVIEQAGFTIYDSAPGTTAQRAYYITGFDDGCARQFTGALVLAGDVGTHEVVRYETMPQSAGFSATDTSYEQIKGAFCGVPAGRSCGGRIDALATNTVFVTAYERFQSSPRWAEFLLHDGQVAAAAIEGR